MKWHAPDDELDEGRCALVYGNRHRVEVELQEDTRGATTMLERLRVMRHAVLVRRNRSLTRRNVGSRNDVEEVLICNECYADDVSGRA